MTSEQRSALVMWSGGADSTLLLTHLLQEKRPIRILSIQNDQLPAAQEAQEARIKILDKLRERFPSDLPFPEIADIHNTGEGLHKSISIQAELWIMLGAFYAKSNEDVYIGWVHGDQSLHRIKEIQECFNQLQILQGKTGTLLVPLEWMEKWEVLRELKTLDLLDDVWSCETPRCGRPCLEMWERGMYRFQGICTPCKTRWMGIKRLELEADHGETCQEKSISEEVAA